MNVISILRALEDEVTPDGAILLGQLKRKFQVDQFWPDLTFHAALEAFGNSVHNSESPVRKALDRRIRHCMTVWVERYGPLNQEQEYYLDQVLSFSIIGGVRDAGSNRVKRRQFVMNNLAKAVNHEVVDRGFKSRANKKIDASSEVREALGG